MVDPLASCTSAGTVMARRTVWRRCRLSHATEVAVLALDARVRDVREHEMGEGVGEDSRPVAGNVDVTEDEVDKRRGEKDQARQSIEEVRHRVEVAEPLRGAEAGGEERIVDAHDL